MYENEFFPWGGLPYPYEHARLGVELVQKGELEKAKELIPFQQATLDHHGKPLYSLFRQEKGRGYAELEEANRLFFEALRCEPEKESQYINEELGILSNRTPEQTILSLGSGCKSGMGAYLVGEGGVLTFGPQLRPLGECSGFGLAGRARHLEIDATSMHYQCRLAAPHDRDTGIPWMRDSGYCGTWIETTTKQVEGCLSIKSTFEGFRPLSDFLFTFFVKAKACFVAGSHKLNPRSLDRYQGPPQQVGLGEVAISPEGGFKSMEVVPLAGDGAYWGADFLVALTLEQPCCSILLTRLYV